MVEILVNLFSLLKLWFKTAERSRRLLALGTPKEDGLALVGGSRLPSRISHSIVATLATLAVHKRAQKVVRLEALVVRRHFIGHIVRIRRHRSGIRRLVDHIYIGECFAVPVVDLYGLLAQATHQIVVIRGQGQNRATRRTKFEIVHLKFELERFRLLLFVD